MFCCRIYKGGSANCESRRGFQPSAARLRIKKIREYFHAYQGIVAVTEGEHDNALRLQGSQQYW